MMVRFWPMSYMLFNMYTINKRMSDILTKSDDKLFKSTDTSGFWQYFHTGGHLSLTSYLDPFWGADFCLLLICYYPDRNLQKTIKKTSMDMIPWTKLCHLWRFCGGAEVCGESCIYLTSTTMTKNDIYWRPFWKWKCLLTLYEPMDV